VSTPRFPLAEASRAAPFPSLNTCIPTSKESKAAMTCCFEHDLLFDGSLYAHQPVATHRAVRLALSISTDQIA
jgi:hypothetical protein